MNETKKLDRWWDRILDDEPRLRHASDEDVRSIFVDRAISDEVRHARPFVPYDAGDWDAVIAADPSFAELSSGRRGYLRKLVNQRPGLVMRRAGWPGPAPIVAQLRPFKFKELGFDVAAAYGAEDEGVFSTSWQHDHASPQWHYHERDHAVAVTRTRRRKHRDESEERTMAEHVAESHDGIVPLDNDVHPHRLSRRGHVARKHAGEIVVGQHEHGEFAKYVYPPGEPTKRIDVHPLAWPLLEAGGDVAYFALEGVLKNDAILSVDSGTPVVNVGSVTLWQDRALAWFASTYLTRFRTVVVVPDSDGSGNDDVSSQAKALARALRDHGVNDVVVAAPTAKCGEVCTHLTRDAGRGVMLPQEDHKRGVDDFVGDGHDLREMVLDVRRETPAIPVLDGRRADRRQNVEDVGRYAQDIVGPHGHAVTTTRQIGDATRMSDTTAWRALHDLEEQGVVGLGSVLVWRDSWRGGMPPTTVDVAAKYLPTNDRTTLGDYLDRR